MYATIRSEVNQNKYHVNQFIVLHDRLQDNSSVKKRSKPWRPTEVTSNWRLSSPHILSGSSDSLASYGEP